jgi:hypothetical protein
MIVQRFYRCIGRVLRRAVVARRKEYHVVRVAGVSYGELLVDHIGKTQVGVCGVGCTVSACGAQIVYSTVKIPVRREEIYYGTYSLAGAGFEVKIVRVAGISGGPVKNAVSFCVGNTPVR